MNRMLWYINALLYLDIEFLNSNSWTIYEKLEFLVKKYYLSFKYLIGKFELGKNNIKIFGESIYYNSKYALFFYQVSLVTFDKFLRSIKSEKISTIIDVGANVGFFSKIATKIFPNAKIYAIEPTPGAMLCLKKNFHSDTHVKFVEVALLDKIGTIRMNVNAEDCSQSQINTNGNLEIHCVTLDRFIRDKGIIKVDLLKIDVETFEAHVLRGGQKTLDSTKYLLLEISLIKNNNYTFTSLMSLLSKGGHNFQLLDFREYRAIGKRELVLLDCFFVNTNLYSE